ncbi:uncharacterized protein LOC117315459 [Pecten maximus]|uniref:uncharacterized protein LOC117315459 n=1 Tax=Pecten maximus TaxID=6579 RepID=UPI001457F8C9|nr:uncharacterized protein LOC117315459 [Pecten maximus]
MKRAAPTSEEDLPTPSELCGIHQLLPTKNFKVDAINITDKIRTRQQHPHLTVKTDAEIKPDRTHANITFTVSNDFDIKRKQSVKDIRQRLDLKTKTKDRFGDIGFIIQCIIVSVDIRPPRTPFEPTALCLAERVRAFLLYDDITLSDETQTRLHVKKKSINITLKDRPTDGLPLVGIGQAAFAFHVGKVVILQGTAISDSVTCIQWYKVEDDGTERTININNKKYLGGSRQSPSLIIAHATKEDGGIYILEATNVNGTVRSERSQLIILDAGEQLEPWTDEPSNNENEDDSDTDSSSEDEDADKYSVHINSTTNTTDSSVQNSSQNASVSASGVNTTADGVAASTEEDGKNKITAIVNEAAHILGENSRSLVTSLVSPYVDKTVSRVRAEFAPRLNEDDSSDDDQALLPEFSLTKEESRQPVRTRKDSDDCSR